MNEESRTVTTAAEVIEFFESSFRDKEIIPTDLELKWLERAVAQYSQMVEKIEYDRKSCEFGTELDTFVQTNLAQYMRVYYQERETSKINKRVSIVSKDLSIDGAGHTKTAMREELNYHKKLAKEMEHSQFDTAYGDTSSTSESEKCQCQRNGT